MYGFSILSTSFDKDMARDCHDESHSGEVLDAVFGDPFEPPVEEVDCREIDLGGVVGDIDWCGNNGSVLLAGGEIFLPDDFDGGSDEDTGAYGADVTFDQVGFVLGVEAEDFAEEEFGHEEESAEAGEGHPDDVEEVDLEVGEGG